MYHNKFLEQFLVKYEVNNLHGVIGLCKAGSLVLNCFFAGNFLGVETYCYSQNKYLPIA